MDNNNQACESDNKKRKINLTTRWSVARLLTFSTVECKYRITHKTANLQ